MRVGVVKYGLRQWPRTSFLSLTIWTMEECRLHIYWSNGSMHHGTPLHCGAVARHIFQVLWISRWLLPFWTCIEEIIRIAITHHHGKKFCLVNGKSTSQSILVRWLACILAVLGSRSRASCPDSGLWFSWLFPDECRDSSNLGHRCAPTLSKHSIIKIKSWVSLMTAAVSKVWKLQSCPFWLLFEPAVLNDWCFQFPLGVSSDFWGTHLVSTHLWD